MTVASGLCHSQLLNFPPCWTYNKVITSVYLIFTNTFHASVPSRCKVVYIAQSLSIKDNYRIFSLLHDITNSNASYRTQFRYLTPRFIAVTTKNIQVSVCMEIISHYDYITTLKKDRNRIENRSAWTPVVPTTSSFPPSLSTSPSVTACGSTLPSPSSNSRCETNETVRLVVAIYDVWILVAILSILRPNFIAFFRLFFPCSI